MLHCPIGLAAADPKSKIIENFLAARRMRDFWMKLHTKKPARRVGERRDRRIAAVRETAPTGRHSGHLIAMTHPHPQRLVFLKPIKHIGVAVDHQIGRTVFAMVGARHTAAGGKIDHAHTVANSQKWYL